MQVKDSKKIRRVDSTVKNHSRPVSTLADLIRQRATSSASKPKATTLAAERYRRATRLSEWRIGRLLRQGGFIALPVIKYFSLLQELALKRKYVAHERVLIPGLAHYAIASDEAAGVLFAHMLAYVQGSHRLNGLEGFFLSAWLMRKWLDNELCSREVHRCGADGLLSMTLRYSDLGM